MIGATVKTRMFTFDRKVIKTNWKKINESPVKKAGLLVRRIARSSIRRGNHRGLNKDIKQGRDAWGRFQSKQGVNPFERKIRERKHSKPGKPPRSWQRGSTPPFKMIYSVPDAMGTSTVVGMVGFGSSNPVPGLHEHGGTATRRVYTKVRQHRTKRGRFGKNRYKPMRKVVSYPKRPFMQPALDKAKTKLPPLWDGSLGKT